MRLAVARPPAGARAWVGLRRRGACAAPLRRSLRDSHASRCQLLPLPGVRTVLAASRGPFSPPQLLLPPEARSTGCLSFCGESCSLAQRRAAVLLRGAYPLLLLPLPTLLLLSIYRLSRVLDAVQQSSTCRDRPLVTSFFPFAACGLADIVPSGGSSPITRRPAAAAAAPTPASLLGRRALAL